MKICSVLTFTSGSPVDLSTPEKHGKNNSSTINLTQIHGISRFSPQKTLIGIYQELYTKARHEGFDAPTTIITCTQTPDRAMPVTSLDLISQLSECSRAAYFDVSSGCTGFVDQMRIVSAIAKEAQGYIYCFSGDISSRITNKDDYSTSMVFGDAISLVVIDATSVSSSDYCLFHSRVSHTHQDAIYRMHDSKMFMDGLEVLNFVIHSTIPFLNEYISQLQQDHSLKDYSLVLHQANAFIVNKINKSIKAAFPEISTHDFSLNTIGNPSSSSIPIAISHEKHRLKENLIICGFGVGMATSIGCIKLSSSAKFYDVYC